MEAGSRKSCIASLRAKLGAELKAILVSDDTSPSVKGLHLDRYLRVACKPIQAEQLLRLITELLSTR